MGGRNMEGNREIARMDYGTGSIHFLVADLHKTKCNYLFL